MPLGRFLQSFRGRYTAISTVLVLVLVTAAIGGRSYVQHRATGQLDMIEDRALAADLAADAEQQVQALESRVQRFMMVPGSETRVALERAIELERASLDKLHATQWLRRHPDLHQLAGSLQQDNERLLGRVRELVASRTDVRVWFPAMRVMQGRMLPASNALFEELDAAIREARAGEDRPGQRRALELFNRASRAGHRMRSEFRLFVANRFGIFSGEPERAMAARARNIEIYAARFRQAVEDLRELQDPGQLGFRQKAALEAIPERFSTWRKGYEEVSRILRSDRWRRDVVQLEEEVDPVLERVYQRLSTLQLEIKVASARDITQLTAIAQRLSQVVVALAVVGALAVVLGYVLFTHGLITPISRITQALRAEARGESVPEVMPRATMRETQALIEAFGQMREQVSKRQSRLDHLAHHDPLTQLPNRLLFRDRLEHALDMAARRERLMALMFLDLDQFKQINDSLGHEVGDQLLAAVAVRLSSMLRRSDTVARLGGDEFAILLEDLSYVEEVTSAAYKILEAFEAPFWVGDHELHTTVSIGIALCPFDDRAADVLVKDADAAMYHAKELGRNNFQFFSADITARAEENLRLETGLRHAVRDGAFELHYQPIIELSTENVAGCEALLRWPTANEPVGPAKFVPVLEATGLIVPVTEWIVAEVCREYRRLREAGIDCPVMTINLTARLLHGGRLPNHLRQILMDEGMAAESLIAEVTEDALIRDHQAAKATLRGLKDLGVRVALDDFGTGQSSLNHLRHFPVDYVKIDRDFVRDVPDDPWDSDLVDAIIRLAHRRGIEVVAEGVETEEQLAFLRERHCEYVQGFLFAPALTPSELLAYICGRSDAPAPAQRQRR